MDLEKLEAFVRVVEAGSLSAAARDLLLGPSGLSRQIAALESEMAGRLLHRTGRGVELTDLGERVLPRAKAVLLEAAALKNEASAAAGHFRGRVSVAVVPALAGPLVTRIVTRARERYPDVVLHFSMGLTGHVEQLVADGKVDIAITMRAEPKEGEQALTTSRLVLASKPGDHLTAAPEFKFSRLDGVPLVRPGSRSAFSRTLEKLAAEHGVRLSFVAEIDWPEATMRLVQAGGVYALLSEMSIREYIHEGALGSSVIVEPSMEASFYLISSPYKSASLASRELSRFIREQVEEFFRAKRPA